VDAESAYVLRIDMLSKRCFTSLLFYNGKFSVPQAHNPSSLSDERFGRRATCPTH